MRFTTQTIRALKPTEKLYWLDDETLPGFRVAVTPRGVKTFAVRLRKGGRANRQDTTQVVGRFGLLTVDEAKTKARGLLSRWSLGQDVVGERRATREAATIADLSARFLAEWEGRRKPGTVREYRRLFEVEILPKFGNLSARDLSRGKVARWHGKIGERAPVVANRSLRLLRTFYRWAETRGEIPEGTAATKGVAFFPERDRERFLSADELQRLGESLNRAAREGLPPDPKRAGYAKRRSGKEPGTETTPANPWGIAAIRFLLLSGWREQEALTLRWDAVELATGRVSLAETKTGRSWRSLGAAALDVLQSVPRADGSPFVFPGRTADVPLVEIKHLWHAVRFAAKLEDVRLHDLRHTFASAAVEGGTPLYTTGALLGHRDLKSTARYGHLADDPMKRAADATSGVISARLDGRKTEIVKLSQERTNRGVRLRPRVRKVR
jgi:integrase